MIMQQKNRNRKKAGRRHSLGAPLEPIYEHEHAGQCGTICTTPLEVYMSETIRNHHAHHRKEESSISTRKTESEFQIITDNPSSHPEFITKWRATPSKLLLSPSPTKVSKASCEGRWGNGDSPPLNPKNRDLPLGNDSNSSINTESTSSLTVSLFDAEDDCADFFDESTLNTQEIIKQAADVVAGKYDYNNNTPIQQQQSNNNNNGTMRRRQGRRSSMPMMPVRQESIRNINSSSEASPPSNAVVKVDKFGIPIPQTSSSPSTSRRRRKGRRSSLGDKPSVESQSQSQQQVDKYGIPIPQRPLESGSNHSKGSTHSTSSKTRRRRQERRSSMGDKPSIETPVDKFGIPISSPPESTSSTTRRRQGRRSSMPTTRSVSFDLPPPSAAAQAEEEKKDDQSGTVPVDKFGIPIWPKDMIGNNHNSKGRRRKQERRASLGDVETSKNNRSCRRGRRPSPPVLMTSSNTSTMTASNASAMRFFPEELQIQGRSSSAGSTTSKPEAANGAPIRPERVPSIDNFGSQHGRTCDMTAQPNAIFSVVVSPKPNQNKLDDVLKGGKDKAGVLGSDVSVNSMQQKDGEWWW